MDNEFKDLDDRLAAADPAERFDASLLSEDILQRAVTTKHRASRRVLTLSSLGTLAAASVVVALVASTPAPLINLGGQSAIGAQESRMGSSKLAADSMAPIFSNFEYFASDDLSDAAGNGHIYQVKASENGEAVLKALAAEFGIAGKVDSQDYGTGVPALSIGDPTKEYISFDQNSGNWYFGDGTAYAAYSCAMPSEESGSTEEGAAKDIAVCEQPTQSAVEKFPMPTKSEAVNLFKALMSASGQSASDYKFGFESADWGASATATFQIDGQDTPLAWYASWTENGQLASANGFAGEVVDLGDYETISAKAAVTRLADWRWFASAAPEVYNTFAPAVRMDDRALTDGTVSSSSEPAVGGPLVAEPGSGEAGEGTSAIEPMPMPEEQPIETKRIEINRALSTLAVIWDASGRQWLVPAYALASADGLAGVVLAVKDGVIKLPEANDGIMPMVK